MIASLLAASLLLGQQNLDDYLPGGPDRVHAEALEWLERATERMEGQETLRLEFTETFRGASQERVLFLRRGIGWEDAPGSEIPAPSGDLPALDELHLEIDPSNAWQHGPLAGNLPLLAWLSASGPGFASLRLEENPNASVAARLHWVEDGLRGQLDLDNQARVLHWTWEGDDHWYRMGHRSGAVRELRVAQLDELSEEFQRAERLFFDSSGPCRESKPTQTWKPANEAFRDLLLPYAKSRGLRISAELTIQLGETSAEAVVLGSIQIDGQLYWPARGKLSMKGEIGPPDNRKPVDTEIAGDGRQLWHWDHTQDLLRNLPGLSELLAGLQGVLPVYAWAARSSPDSGWTAEWISEPGHETRWLRVFDGPTCTDFFLSGTSIQHAIVRAANAREGAPIMHYRFTAFCPISQSTFADYQASRERVLKRVAREDADLARKDPRTEELLPIGERAPSAVAWQTLQGASESLEALRGKPVVLCLWYRDATSCEPALRHLSRLRARLDRIGARSHFRAIAVDEASGDLPPWLEDRSIVLPVGVSSSAQLKRAFRARWLPTTYLIGVDGVVLGRWLGVPNRELEEQLQSLLDRN